MGLISVWADKEGFFELRLNTGQGAYRVHAEPPEGLPSSDEVSDLIDARFGRNLNLANNEQVEVDLAIFEPALIPLRVLDHRGEPLKDMHAVLHVTFPSGGKMTHDAPHSLDGTGRISFRHYFPATELWYEIAAPRGGPSVETPRFACVPGAALEERTRNVSTTLRHPGLEFTVAPPGWARPLRPARSAGCACA